MPAEVDRTTEIERRFLVRSHEWRGAGEAVHILQGYLSTDRARVVRVRVSGEDAWLTIKGRSDRAGARTEIEFPIPIDDARTILSHPAGLCVGTIIDKTRTRIRAGGLLWEVDEFHGRNDGLLIAEVEYDGGRPVEEWAAAVDQQRPVWLGDEVTSWRGFSNSALTERPFDEWPADERAAILEGTIRGGI